MRQVSIRKFAAVAVVAISASSQGGVLFDNGPVVTNPSGGTGTIAGQPISSPQGIPSSPPGGPTNFTAGVGASWNENVRVADDFIVSGDGWDLDSVSLFAFQSNATSPTVTHAYFNLWTAAPFSANSPPPLPDPLPQPMLLSSLEVPVSSSQFVAYRQTGTGTSSSTRPIYRYEFSLDGLPNGGVLSPGTYWLEWSLLGTGAAGTSAGRVWVPLVTPRESAPDLNARLFAAIDGNPATPYSWFEGREIQWFQSGSSWAGQFVQPYALPFVLRGTAVPEPTVAGSILAGAVLLARRRRVG
jgi:hypothetical protein